MYRKRLHMGSTWKTNYLFFVALQVSGKTNYLFFVALQVSGKTNYLFFVALQVSGKTELEEVQFSCSLEQLQVNIPM